MRFADRTYPDIVRDLLTVLTGGTASEVVMLGDPVPDLIRLNNTPVKRISHLQGQVLLGDELSDYRFTERDFQLVGTDENPADFTAIRFREPGKKPAPGTTLSINYYPTRLKPTPLNDVNVGSVVRTLIETMSREVATQYQQLQLVYDSAFVGTATGSSLDNVVALLDVRRLRKGHPVGKVRFSRRSGSPGVIFVPVQTAVLDADGNRYLTASDATLQPNQATVEVWVAGESARTRLLEPGTLTILDRVISGIDRTTNDEPTWRATDDESDEQLRSRARGAVHGAGRGTRDALQFGLESLPFVTAVGLREYDPNDLSAVPMPGMLRVDVALSEDNPHTRSVVNQRIQELRPAGIYVVSNFAEKVQLRLGIQLELAGSGQASSVVEEIKNGVRTRLSEYVLGLGPGATLRRARMTTLILSDARIVDASFSVSADGSGIDSDVWTVPPTRTTALQGADAIVFDPVKFEQAAVTTGNVLVQIDADLAVVNPRLPTAELEARFRQLLGASIGSLAAGAALGFDRVANAVRDDQVFALRRADSVVSVEVEGGSFTEIRDGDAVWTVPANATLKLRAVRVREVET